MLGSPAGNLSPLRFVSAAIMGFVENLVQDLRHAGRTLRRDATFTVTALLILAVGIGANTAVFSIVNGVLLRPLAYREPDRLFFVYEIVPQLANAYPLLPVNGRHFLEWKRQCTSFEDVGLTEGAEFNLTGSGEPERLVGARLTANFFDVLGVPAQAGRTFAPEEGQPGQENVVVLSDSLWRRRFAADPNLVGKTVNLDGTPHTVVGILPASFRHHVRATVGRPRLESQVDVFKPWPFQGDEWGWAGDFNYAAVARLRKGVTPRQADAELNVIQAQIAKHFLEENVTNIDLRGQLIALQDEVVERGRAGLLMLLAAVGAVLLIACVNLGNSMLVRASGRVREAAIRVALGASRWRVFGGALAESGALALAGGALGVALAFGFLRLFVALAPPDLPRADEVSMDWRALLFALAASIAAAVVFGLLPAFRLTRANPQDSLRAGGRSLTEGGGKLRLRELLVSVEVGLSVTLLVVAGLLMTSFIRLGAVDRGYDAQNVLTAEVSLPATRYAEGDQRRQFFDELTGKLETQPGVVSAGIISVLPLRGQTWTDMVTVEGETRPIAERPIVPYRPISEHYLSAMGIALRTGRSIEQRDYPRKTAVVSASAAERFWPGQNPIGKRFWRFRTDQPAFEVVGVAADVRADSLQKEPEPMVYVPLWERAPGTVSVALRTTADPRAAVGALRETVRSLDPQVPLSAVQTMVQVVDNSVAQRRFQTLLVIAFAAGALLLAGLGTYSVLAYAVTRRTNEIGIRMALGAEQRDVLTLILRQGLWPVVVGLAAGVAGALAVGRVLASLLFAVSPSDATTFASVAVVTLGTAMLACWLPARRAARIAPIEALRYE